MKLEIFSVWDARLKAFNTPWFSPNSQTAIRDCSMLVRRPETKLGEFPEDYWLYKVGEWDDESGELVDCESEKIARLDQLQVQEELPIHEVINGAS